MPSSARSIRAGSAYVELFTKDGKLVSGLARAQKRVAAFAAGAKAAGMELLTLGAGLATPLAIGTKTFADFERQMANVSTMLDKPEEHMATFTRGIREMSVRFGESTEALAGGLYDILSASIDPAKALSVLEVAVKAAKGGMTDTKTAADALTTVLNSYKLSAGQAADVSDWLFTVVKRGKTTFGQLAPAIGQVASIGSVAGLSLDEMGAALATMTRNGVQTEDAVTALRAIISGFISPAKEAQDAAAGMGFKLESATIHGEGLLGVFKRLQGLSADQIAEIFPNVRALKGVAPAIQDLQGFSKDLGLMASRAGNATVAFEKMENTLSAGFEKVKQSVLVTFSVIGEQISEPLGRIARYIVKVMASTADWIKANKALVRVVAIVTVGLLATGAALLVIGVSAKVAAMALSSVLIPLKLITGLVSILISVFGALLSPVGLATAAVVGLGAAILYWTGAGAKALKWLGEKAEILRKDFEQALGGIKDALVAGDFALAAKILWLTLKMEFLRGVQYLERIWLSFKKFFVSTAYAAWYGAVAAVEVVWNGLTAGWVETVAFLSQVWNVFVGAFKASWETMKAWAEKAWIWIRGLFDGGYDKQAAYEAVDQKREEALSQIANEQDRKTAAIELERIRKRERADRDHKATMAEINRMYASADDALNQDFADRMAKAQSDLDAARREWQASIAAAKRTRTDTGLAAGGGPQDMGQGIGSVLEAVKAAERVASGVAVRGTFNAAGVAGLGTGGEAALRTAAATEKTAKNTQELIYRNKRFT